MNCNLFYDMIGIEEKEALPIMSSWKSPQGQQEENGMCVGGQPQLW